MENSFYELVGFVLRIIAFWKIFEKAGESGWKCLIPFYDLYIMFRIVGRNFWKYFGLLIGLVFLYVLAHIIQDNNQSISLILILIMIVILILLFIEMVKVYHSLSIGFGHGAWFTVGLFFLTNIFLLVLAFENNKFCHNRISD